MTALLAQLLLAFSFAGTVRAGAHALVDVLADDGNARISGKARALLVQREDENADPDADDEDADADAELQVVPPVPAVPPVPPVRPGIPRFSIDLGGASDRELPPFSEKARKVPTVDVLHRIASTAGWSLTLVGVGKDRIDVDADEVDPREALRQVLKASGSMGVLRRDRLVVVPAPEPKTAGMLVEQSARKVRRDRSGSGSGARPHGHDTVRVFQGDLVVPQGTVVQGDVVNVGGSIELEPGSVVQGDAVSILGSTTIDEGAVVLGDAAALPGGVVVQPGGQVR